MGRAKWTSPFPELQLSREDAERIEQLALMIVHKNLAQYEEYLGPGRGQVDERKWKFMRQRENVRVFAEHRRRKPKTKTSRRHHREQHHWGPLARGAPPDSTSSQYQQQQQTDSSLPSPTPSESGSGFASTPASAELPVVHVVGSVEGALDDIVYGILNPSLDTMRVKTAYIHVNLADIAVLETLASPTLESPFQSLTIKWVVNSQKLLLRPAVNNRDFIYIEATGVTHTSNGERVGYHLLHSVHFPQTHELEGLVRGNMSACGLYRQKPENPNEVDVFFKGILDPGGLAMRSLVVIAAVDVFIAIWKYVECSRLKKLTWLMRTRSRSVSSTGGESGYNLSVDGSSTNATDSTFTPRSLKGQPQQQCVACNRSPSVSLLTGLRRRRCSLCYKYVCSSCKVRKTLCHLTSAEAKLLEREFAFCPACYEQATRANAFEIAQQEFAAMGAYTFGSELFTSTNSEGSSRFSRFSVDSLAESLFS
ncbi:hypothetical protein Gpo141_00003868 [Globisporangium polare]